MDWGHPDVASSSGLRRLLYSRIQHSLRDWWHSHIRRFIPQSRQQCKSSSISRRNRNRHLNIGRTHSRKPRSAEEKQSTTVIDMTCEQCVSLVSAAMAVFQSRKHSRWVNTPRELNRPNTVRLTFHIIQTSQDKASMKAITEFLTPIQALGTSCKLRQLRKRDGLMLNTTWLKGFNFLSCQIRWIHGPLTENPKERGERNERILLISQVSIIHNLWSKQAMYFLRSKMPSRLMQVQVLKSCS